MSDYAEYVRSTIASLPQPPVVMGWSMGGLVAMMVAASGEGIACVALAPSMPARETDHSTALRTGEFGPEEYGITSSDPQQQPGLPDLDLEERKVALASLCRESRFARDERRAGIVIASVACPLLLVTGTADTGWPLERYDGLWLDAEFLSVQGASHWGLVLSRNALSSTAPTVLGWLNHTLRV